MLVLARRRSFTAVEILAVIGMLVTSFAFAPNTFAGWSNEAAAVVASAFFVLFAIVYSLRPLDERAPRVMQLMRLIFTSTLYLCVLELLLSADHALLGIMLAVLAALLFGAAALIR